MSTHSTFHLYIAISICIILYPENIRKLGLKLNLENWNEVFNTSNVDEKVNKFTATLTNSLDQCLPERSIKFHLSEKPQITPQIKREIKKRQQTYTRGDTGKYKEKCEKVAGLVSKAKLRYYRSKVENVKHHDQGRWYKSIYKLAAAEEPRGTISAPELAAERLVQRDYKVPFLDLGKTLIQQKYRILMMLHRC